MAKRNAGIVNPSLKVESAEKLDETTKWLNVNNHKCNLWDENTSQSSILKERMPLQIVWHSRCWNEVLSLPRIVFGVIHIQPLRGFIHYAVPDLFIQKGSTLVISIDIKSHLLKI